MSKTNRFRTTGFIALGEPPARRSILAATVDIAKGDILHDDGNGKATNAITAFAATCLGVAAAPCNNTPDASLSVEYYPLDTKTQYIVPVGSNAVITQTIIGTKIDMYTVNTIDISNTTTEGVAFFVDEIDASAAAVAINTYGYAIGHFVVVATQAG